MTQIRNIENSHAAASFATFELKFGTRVRTIRVNKFITILYSFILIEFPPIFKPAYLNNWTQRL